MEFSQDELFLIKNIFRRIARQIKSQGYDDYVYHDYIVFDSEDKENIESILQKIDIEIMNEIDRL